MGFPEEDIQALLVEINFWLTNTHPCISQIEEVVQEDPFIYTVYEMPAGGTLESVLFASDNVFSEAFARGIASSLLEGLAFLHLKGVVHGNCLPAGIFFRADHSVPGWPQTAQLSTVKVNYHPSTNTFLDLKDLAYTMCAIVRRGSGVFSRQDFNPVLLKTREWDFLTQDFVEFVNQLWNADKTARGAEYFMEHRWMVSFKKVFTKSDIKSRTCVLDYKLNTKKSGNLCIRACTLFYIMSFKHSRGESG